MTPEIEEDQHHAQAGSHDAPLQSPGAMVRRARERARLSLDELATQTKLSRNTLDALERDDFNALLEPVYVRGYYRKCAKVLDIPEQELIDAYQSRVMPRPTSAPAKLRLASGTDAGPGRKLPVSIALVVAVIAVVVVSLAWFARERSQGLPPTVAERAEVPVESLESDGEVPTFESTAPPSEVPESVAPETVAPVAPPPAVTEAPAAPAPTAPGLRLTVTATSWVRIDDASGKTLINGLVRTGESQQFSGPLPLSVFLGNAPGVKVEFGGQSIDISGMTRSNNTARFTLPLTGTQ